MGRPHKSNIQSGFVQPHSKCAPIGNGENGGGEEAPPGGIG
jgi:hypothetical protein